MRRGLFQKRFGGNNIISAGAINIGSTKGLGSSTRRFIYCKERTNDFTGCLEQIINIQKAQIQPIQKSQFIYSVIFLIGSPPTKEDILQNLPIINDDNSFTEIEVYLSIISTVATITIEYLFNDVNPTGNDGLSFSVVLPYYNSYSDLTIIDFGGIPLSRNTFGGTGQFENLLNIMWNTSSSPTILSNTHFSSTFGSLSNFNSSVSNWNTVNVISMDSTFSGCTNFNNGGVPFTWNTENVTNMEYMFYSCEVFNQPVGTFNTTNVTTMYGMFTACSLFNQDISYDAILNYWNTSSVVDMSYMFYTATNFNNGYAAGDTSHPMNWIVTQTSFPDFFGELSNLTTYPVPGTSNNNMFGAW